MYEITVKKVRRNFKFREILITCFIGSLILISFLVRIMMIIDNIQHNEILDKKKKLKILFVLYSTLVILLLFTCLVLLKQLRSRYNYEYRLQYKNATLGLVGLWTQKRNEPSRKLTSGTNKTVKHGENSQPRPKKLQNHSTTNIWDPKNNETLGKPISLTSKTKNHLK